MKEDNMSLVRVNWHHPKKDLKESELSRTILNTSS